MKNNLRQLRERGGWSQAEIGRRLGLAHNSVSGYESGKPELDTEMREKFAKALEVSAADIVEEDEPFARFNEDATPYRVSSIAINLLPADLLKLIVKSFSDLLPGSTEPNTGAIMHSLFSLTQELKRRDEVILHTKSKPKPSSVLTSQEEEILSAHMKAIEPETGGSGGSSPRSGAGGHIARKPSPPSPSGQGAKPPHPGSSTKVQK